jgi:hypothetical protein
MPQRVTTTSTGPSCMAWYRRDSNRVGSWPARAWAVRSGVGGGVGQVDRGEAAQLHRPEGAVAHQGGHHPLEGRETADRLGQSRGTGQAADAVDLAQLAPALDGDLIEAHAELPEQHGLQATLLAVGVGIAVGRDR